MATTSSTGVGERFGEDQCRAEVAAVLSSDSFRRSRKLSRLLTYLCDKELSGRATEITEYAIAIEVLGRPPQFDPQQDAVVRVDTHHLRKKLKEYYAGPGADREIQILIPNGRYAAQFAARNATILPEQPSAPEPAVPKPPDIRKWWRGRWWLAALVAGLLAAGAVWVYEVEAHRRASVLPAAAASGDELRIAAGDRGQPYIDSAGRIWLTDRYFTGGTAYHRAGPIQRTHDPELFEYGREGQFVYTIPLGGGIYELHLYFAETGVASDTLRSVNIALNGHPASAVDIASDAGGINVATMKIFKDVEPGKDGFLHIMFQGAESQSFLNGIEIVPGTPGKIRPIRITAGDHAFRDHAGQLWLPDAWASGGRISARMVNVESTPDPALYQWERVGHFTYSIPVAEGETYTVVLHFSETWFTPSSSRGGAGSRIFDVYCNGTTLLKDFDILKESGGIGNRAVIRVFHHLSPSPVGKIELQFLPVANYALINAIEILPE